MTTRQSGIVLVWLLAGCYTYTPLATPDPVSGTRVALVLSDQGRVGMAPRIGAGVARVEGALVGSSDSDYVLQVSDVFAITGRHDPWTAETVHVQRAYVANTLERRYSRKRTYIAVAAATAALVALVVSRNLLGIGGATVEPPPCCGGQSQ